MRVPRVQWGMSGLGLLVITLAPAAMAAEPSATSAPSPAPIPITDLLQATIPVEGSPDWPTAAFGSVWVLAPDLPLHGTGTPQLVRIDPETNGVVGTIELPDRLCQGFVATDDALWACAADALVRIDPATNAVVDRVLVTGASGAYRLAAGGGFVWALGSGGFNADTVLRLDPATGAVEAFPLGGVAGGIAYAFDTIWASIPDQGVVVRVDPATAEVIEMASGLPAPAQLVAVEDGLWVSLDGEAISLYPSEGGASASAGDPQVVHLAPDGTVTAQLAVGGSPRGGVDLWAGDGRLLVRSTQPWLTEADTARGEITGTVTSEPDVPAINGPLTVAFGSIWTVNIEAASVFRPSAP